MIAYQSISAYFFTFLLFTVPAPNPAPTGVGNWLTPLERLFKGFLKAFYSEPRIDINRLCLLTICSIIPKSRKKLEKKFGRNIVRTGFVDKNVPFKQGFLTAPIDIE